MNCDTFLTGAFHSLHKRVLRVGITILLIGFAGTGQARAQSEGVDREPEGISDLLKQENANPDHLVGRAPARNSPVYWITQGQTLADTGKYDEASDAFQKAADLYQQQGVGSRAAASKMMALRYQTVFKLYYHRRTNRENVTRYYTKRRLEPIYGAYLGAFIQGEDSLKEVVDHTGRVFRDSDQFNKLVGKKHALFLTYAAYGAKLPDGWFRHLKAAGAGVVLALEPKNLRAVRDDATLHNLANELANAGIPVFLRFGSEMNGTWTPWHGDPTLYKDKFKLVAGYMHKHCPNVAMVWCPNDIPEEEIPAYYPGVDAVDWVGVNFYMTYFRNNNPNDAIPWRNPADKLDYIYGKYAAQHPIMIGETGAAYQQSCDNKVRNDYTFNKLNELYLALPRRYPRIKAVTYFSFNSIKHADNPMRRINNYSLAENEAVRKHYLTMILPKYFLTDVTTTENEAAGLSPTEYVELSDGTVLSGKVPLSTYIKTRTERPEVTYKLNGKTLATFNDGGPNSVQTDTKTLPDGAYTLTVEVRSQGSMLANRSVKVVINNSKQSASR